VGGKSGIRDDEKRKKNNHRVCAVTLNDVNIEKYLNASRCLRKKLSSKRMIRKAPPCVLNLNRKIMQIHVDSRKTLLSLPQSDSQLPALAKSCNDTIHSTKR
jgi:hypothetical protein